jgi:hypothetical protein
VWQRVAAGAVCTSAEFRTDRLRISRLKWHKSDHCMSLKHKFHVSSRTNGKMADLLTYMWRRQSQPTLWSRRLIFRELLERLKKTGANIGPDDNHTTMQEWKRLFRCSSSAEEPTQATDETREFTPSGTVIAASYTACRVRWTWGTLCSSSSMAPGYQTAHVTTQMAKAVTLLHSPGRNSTILTEAFSCFPQYLHINARTVKLDNERFLPHPFPFIIHYSLYYLTVYSFK